MIVYIFAYTELSRYYFVYTGTVNLMLSGRNSLSEQIIIRNQSILTLKFI